MARRYVRDARGRFASSGYSGQTGGRGARLMAKNTRPGGGAKITAAKVQNTLAKPRGLKPAVAQTRAATSTPTRKLTTRQKAKRLGAMRLAGQEQPRTLSSVPKGTIGGTGTYRDLKRLDSKARSTSLKPGQAPVFDVSWKSGGMTTSTGGMQLRRNAVGIFFGTRGPSKRVAFANARGVFQSSPSPKFAEAMQRSREASKTKRRQHSPGKRRSTR